MSDRTEPREAERPLRKGARVEVRTGFDGSWVPGYSVESVHPDGYRLRRRADGEVLPVVFPPTEVRKEHNRSMWWV